MEKKRIFLFICLICLLFILSGCATKIKEDYDASKIDPKLLSGELPTYVVNDDGTLNVNVVCYPSFKYTNCSNVIKKYGEILEEISPTLYKIKADKNSLYKLTKEKGIQFIEKSNPPAVDLKNDKI